MSTPPSFDPDLWRDVATANLSDVIGRVGAMDGGIRRMCGDRMAGPAHTITTGLGDSSSIHRGLVDAPPGSIVVIDAQGGVSRAVWGYVLTMAARQRGVVGAVIDGAIRDLDEIGAAGFPVYARATCPGGPHKGFRGSHGVPIQCGGVVVNAGDIVVGDADGVTVVPVDRADTALAEVERVAALEQGWLERIRAGEATAEFLGLQ